MVKINVDSLFSAKNGRSVYVYGMLCVNELTLLVLYNIKNDCVCTCEVFHLLPKFSL